MYILENVLWFLCLWFDIFPQDKCHGVYLVYKTQLYLFCYENPCVKNFILEVIKIITCFCFMDCSLVFFVLVKKPF